MPVLNSASRVRSSIPDVKSGSTGAESVYALYEKGILSGVDSSLTFNPTGTMTRAEAAALAARIARAEQRIAKTLVYLQRAYGQPVAGGVRINLHFTCAELAALVNTSRVTVNNTLLELTRAGTLAKEGSLYIVRDVRALQDLAVQMLDE